MTTDSKSLLAPAVQMDRIYLAGEVSGSWLSVDKNKALVWRRAVKNELPKAIVGCGYRQRTWPETGSWEITRLLPTKSASGKLQIRASKAYVYGRDDASAADGA